MTEQWLDISRKTTQTDQPGLDECIIEIHTTAKMPTLWIGHLKQLLDQRDVRYSTISGDQIVARAADFEAVQSVVSAIEWAILGANAAYRTDIGSTDA